MPQQPEAAAVYYTLRDIFSGQNAFIRSNQTIKKRIKENTHNHAVAALVDRYSLTTICATTKFLLAEGIFSSEAKAKALFADTAPPNTEQVQRAILEAEVSQPRSQEMQEATAARAQMGSANGIVPNPKLQELLAGLTSIPHGHDYFPSTSAPKAQSRTTAHMLPTITIAFPVQHRLLTALQATLEQGCYEFLAKSMPDILERRGWEYPEAVELNLCMQEMSNNAFRFDMEKNQVQEGVAVKPIHILFGTFVELRHKAVHREVVDAARVAEYLLDAEMFLGMLGQGSALKKISKLARRTTKAIEKQAENREILRARLQERLDDLDARRARLDELERESIRTMENEYKAYRMHACRHLGESLTSMESMALFGGGANLAVASANEGTNMSELMSEYEDEESADGNQEGGHSGDEYLDEEYQGEEHHGEQYEDEAGQAEADSGDEYSGDEYSSEAFSAGGEHEPDSNTSVEAHEPEDAFLAKSLDDTTSDVVIEEAEANNEQDSTGPPQQSDSAEVHVQSGTEVPEEAHGVEAPKAPTTGGVAKALSAESAKERVPSPFWRLFGRALVGGAGGGSG